MTAVFITVYRQRALPKINEERSVQGQINQIISHQVSYRNVCMSSGMLQQTGPGPGKCWGSLSIHACPGLYMLPLLKTNLTNLYIYIKCVHLLVKSQITHFKLELFLLKK